MSFKEIAATMVAHNIPVIPIPPREKGARLRDWPKLATTDIAQIERWNEENPQYNCGAVATTEGVWILDCDVPNLAQQIASEAGQTFPPTLAVRSSKGVHYYFKQTKASRAMGNRNVLGLFDAQVSKKYVVAPGSLHPSGILYHIINDGPIAEAPAWLVDWIETRTAKGTNSKIPAEQPSDNKVLEGGRDNFLFGEACKLRAAGMGEAEAVAALIAINARCEPPMSEEVVRQKIGSAYKGGLRRHAVIDKDVPRFTDLGNASRFVHEYGNSIKYSHTESKWWVYDGIRWVLDDTGKVSRMAKDSIKKILEEAMGIENDEQRRALLTHELRSESQQRIRSMITSAQSEDGVPIRLVEFDSDPMLFNVLNGTLELRTGQLRKHAAADLITKLSPVTYQENAECPVWREFLNDITRGDAELQNYLQRCVGYSMTGDTVEQVLFLLYGTGANGKTTFLEALRYVWGDYAQVTDFNTFMTTRSGLGGARNDLARLLGARFVTATESDPDKRLDENLIKQVTGGDTITARYLYSEYFEFIPQFKLWLATNHKPNVVGTDDGIWRRIRLVPFNVHIPDKKQDRRLLRKLKAEAPGILRWALLGLLDYQKHGLQAAAVVEDATSEYRSSQDGLQHFIDECCVEKPGVQAKARELYRAYRQYIQDLNDKPMNERQFCNALVERKFIAVKRSSGKVWLGIGLLAHGE